MIGLYMDQTVTVLRATLSQDPYGNDVPSTVTETTLSGVAVLPPAGQVSQSTEQLVQRDMVTTLRVLFAPAGTDLRALDRIRHGALTYEVVGDPSPYPGALAHVEANLRRVTG